MANPPDEQLDLFSAREPDPPGKPEPLQTAPPRVGNKRKPATESSPPPTQVTRHFLGWHRPLIELASAHLTPSSDSHDFSDTLVLVPTRGARRRLKSALYQRATEGEEAAGLLPPPIISPSNLLALARAPGAKPPAGETLRTAAWMQVLSSVDRTEFPDLFPAEHALDDPSFAGHLAQEFIGLTTRLGEGGVAFSEVNEQCGGTGETGRWDDLGRLEKIYRKELEERGFSDPEALRAAGLPYAAAPAGIRKIIVIALSDPPALTVDVLEQLSKETPVEVCVFAPEEEAERFDLWGRPLVDAWGDVTSHTLPLKTAHLHLLRSPAEQAKTACNLLQESANGEVSLGICDREVATPLRLALEGADIPVYDPEGRPASSSTAAQVLVHLPEILRSGSFAAVARLFREPDALHALALAASTPEDELLRALDRLQENSVPATLRDASALSPVTTVDPAMNRLLGLVQEFIDSPLPDALRSTFRFLFADQQLDPSDPADLANKDFITGVLTAADELHTGGFDLGSGAAGAAVELDLILGIAGRGQSYSPSRPTGTTELTGWLELFWEAAPHAIVLGANEGYLPASIAGDAFLPDRLCAELGLRCNATRLARDAYLLTALLHSREEIGQVDVLLGKVKVGEDPLRPSRLLTLCSDEELPGRVAHLFGSPATPAGEATTGHPWSAAWELQPDRLGSAEDGHRHAPISKMSPTAFRSYLACPFLFYMQQGLRMKEIDPEPGELQANGFGNLAHDTLEAFAKEPELRDSTDAEAISAFLQADLEKRVRRDFGAHPPLPVTIQLDSLSKRLRRAALTQAAHREEGWKIKVDPERVIEWEINGMPVSGKVDRIDEHEETGEILIVDYKTSAKGQLPNETHWKKVSKNAEVPDDDLWKIYGSEGAYGAYWTDLQLPLYASRIAKDFGRPIEEISTAYFNLPLALGATQVHHWKLQQDTMESAVTCAEEIVKRVQAGRFWPPCDTTLYAFERLFPRDVEARVDPSRLEHTSPAPSSADA